MLFSSYCETLNKGNDSSGGPRLDERGVLGYAEYQGPASEGARVYNLYKLILIYIYNLYIDLHKG